MQPRKLIFPKDEGRHNTIGEWWYFNGNLRGEDGREFGYMNTLFRMRIPLHTSGVWAKFSGKNIYIYHSIVSDIDNNKFYPHIDYIVHPTSDSFRREGLNVYFSPLLGVRKNRFYYIEQPQANEYCIKGNNLYLQMKSHKAPLLENQNGYVNFFDRPTFYYSLTDIETRGSLFVGNEEYFVTGKSWMDHQWSNVSDIAQDFWNWFSVQLDNGCELVCYEYGHRGQSAKLATLIFEDGSQKSFSNPEITALNRQWASTITKAVYDLAWKISINELDLELVIDSKCTSHEMNFLNINYWEGPTRVSGKMNGAEVKGEGYMELAGRRSILNDFSLLKDKIKSAVRR